LRQPFLVSCGRPGQITTMERDRRKGAERKARDVAVAGALGQLQAFHDPPLSLGIIARPVSQQPRAPKRLRPRGRIIIIGPGDRRVGKESRTGRSPEHKKEKRKDKKKHEVRRKTESTMRDEK